MNAATHGAWVWYELMTPDPQGSADFYQAVVPGWSIVPGPAAQPGYSMIANTDGGMTGGILALDRSMTESGAAPRWLGYIAVRDMTAFIPQLEARGGRVLMPPRDVPGVGAIAMVADCCGVPFYVIVPTPPPGGARFTAFSPTLNGRCGWNELSAGNQADAIDFYSSLFGWSLPGAMDMGPMSTYQFIAHDDEQIGAIMQKRPERPAPVWQYYFRVPSIAAAVEAIGQAGGRVDQGPHEVPDDEWILVGTDPQGAEFCLMGCR